MTASRPRLRSFLARVGVSAAVLGAAVVATAGLAVSDPFGAPLAGAAPVLHCGQAITTSLIMRADLTCSGYSGAALTITASNVTLTLGGHTITGRYGQDVIVITGSHDTVQGGTLRHARAGVFAERLYGDTLTNLTFYTETYGVDVFTSDLSYITFNHFSYYMTTAVYMDFAYGTTVANNSMHDMRNGVYVDEFGDTMSVHGNAITDVFLGIYAYAMVYSTLTTNLLVGNGTRGGTTDSVFQGKLSPQYGPTGSSTGILIEYNSFGEPGVRPLITGGGGLSVTQNGISNFSYGIDIGYLDTGQIAVNFANSNFRDGIFLGFDSAGTLVQNVTEYDTTGIYLTGPRQVTISKSYTAHNFYAGVYITNWYYNPGASVSRSTATSNGQYGFYAEDHPVPGTGNVTRNNPTGSYQVPVG